MGETMIVEFGWFLDRAPWAYSKPGLNRVRVGRKGFVSLLQTRLGLTRSETPNAERVGQYLRRLEALDSPGAWFHDSLAKDPWSTAQALLAARDDAVANGWDGSLPEEGDVLGAHDGGASPLLRTLAAAEHAATADTDFGLSPALADDVPELLAEFEASPLPLGIRELVLQHPEPTFPMVWRRVIDALRRRGVRVTEAAPASRQAELTILQAETEWEAAEHAARWLAAGANSSTAVVCSDSTSVLDQYLSRHGQPRLGVGERSPWRAQDALIPLFFELVWSPVNVHLLAEFLTLPDSPVKRGAARHLLHALREEPGTGGEAWQKAIAEIAGDAKLGPELAADLDAAFSTRLLDAGPGTPGSYAATDTVPGAALVEASAWFASALTARASVARGRDAGRLQGTAAQLKAVLGLLAPLPRVSRQDLRRIVAAVVTPSAEPVLAAEAASWLRLTHLAELGEDVEDALWWGFQSASSPGARRWDAHDAAILARAGVELPTPEELTELTVREALAGASRCGRLLVVQIAQRDGERVEGNPLLEALVAAQPGFEGVSIADRITALTVTPEETTEGDEIWGLSGRSARLVRAKRMSPRLPAPVQEVGANPALAPERLSFTQLESLLGCSLQWALRYRAGLAVPDAAQIPAGSRMLGSFAHKLVEVLHAALRAENRAVPGEDEVRAAVVRLLPHFASELLLPGEKARRIAVEGTLVATVRTFFEQLQRGGVALQEMERPFERELRLRAGGREFAVPVMGRADAVGIDAEGRTVVVDLKWTGTDKYRRTEVAEGRSLQLALYQWAFGEGDVPPDSPTAYYLLQQRTFASAHPHFGEPLTPAQSTAELWGKAVRAAEFTLEQVLAGRVTATAPAEAARAEGEPTAEELAAADGRLHVKPGCRFCDFGALCGLKAEGGLKGDLA